MNAPSPAVSMIQGQLLTNDIKDALLLNALASIRREDFLPENLKPAAYVDEDLHVGGGRYLLEPLVFARLLSLAAITPEYRVLCVGALHGYAAMVTARLASHVTATEVDADMVKVIKAHAQRLNVSNLEVQKVKSLADGYGMSAPYDAIVVCGAIDYVPENLAGQLALGGRFVAVHQENTRPGLPVGPGKGILVKRISNQLQYREVFDAATALLPGFIDEKAFRF